MIRDIVNQLQAVLSLPLTPIGSDTNTPGQGVDCSDFELGVMFTLELSNLTDGDYVLAAQESDDDGAGDPYTDVPVEKYCNDPETADATTGAGGVMVKLGVFSTKKFVRPVVVSTNVTTGASATVTAIQKAELKPTPVS